LKGSLIGVYNVKFVLETSVQEKNLKTIAFGADSQVVKDGRVSYW
jgi:hypothetical protein